MSFMKTYLSALESLRPLYRADTVQWCLCKRRHDHNSSGQTRVSRTGSRAHTPTSETTLERMRCIHMSMLYRRHHRHTSSRTTALRQRCGAQRVASVSALNKDKCSICLLCLRERRRCGLTFLQHRLSRGR
jgi:hypothetical protein